MRRDFERHRLINVARAQTYSDMQTRSVIFISLQNVSKCAFATNLMFLIISTNSDSNLDHFYSLDSFRILRELILYAELIYLNILQICIFGSKISYFFIGLWFELKIVTNESLPQMINCIFLFSLTSEHYHSPQSIFVMKITNFVKSAKTSFSAPLTQKCTRVLRTTLLVHCPAKTDLKTSARQPDPNSLQSPNGMTWAHKTGFLPPREMCQIANFQ